MLRRANNGLSLLECPPAGKGLALLTLATLAALPAYARDPEVARPDLPTVAGAAADFSHHCRGCHGFNGEGTPGHVPRLAGFVGLFTQLPDGRDYLMRVPGVATSRLDDARLAAVLNWMLAALSPGETAQGFPPFTAAEVGAARRDPIVDRRARRAALLAEMRDRHLLAPGEDGFGVSPEARSSR
ncbi:MAG: cystathionine beta-lyase [Acetobacteraceae bacterium]|nr:cystathionine beta-lyase [Acetobacteraceae bacterium]